MVSASPISATLLDGNVLIALSDTLHVHHQAARRWLASFDAPFATCPITQGSMIRILMGTGAVRDRATAIVLLQTLTNLPRHRFWPDAIDYLQVNWSGVLGHRQVTDAYLASLARSKGGRLATFDQGLAALHPDVVELVPAA